MGFIWWAGAAGGFQECWGSMTGPMAMIPQKVHMSNDPEWAGFLKLAKSKAVMACARFMKDVLEHLTRPSRLIQRRDCSLC
ncbi:hypothetical protein ANANG_G00148970 [Anguilla anguilla]|uniref:Uncharacterized protein n=1 Tax=Anguilla anguilla TaxID=7936 RepID=A0A9D3RVK2_ANGAN|nr:hypothetical protein ANANG_G00148970 [Anguilla anguilla]